MQPPVCLPIAVPQVVEACRKAGFTDVIMVQETRGEPDALIVSHLPYGPTAFFSLHNVVQRHDIEDRVRSWLGGEIFCFGFGRVYTPLTCVSCFGRARCRKCTRT